MKHTTSLISNLHDLCRMGLARTSRWPDLQQDDRPGDILIGAFAKHSPARGRHAVTIKTAARMGMTHRLHDRAIGVRIWETKVLELSRALATEPKALLVDEPMAGLNPLRRPTGSDRFSKRSAVPVSR